MIPDDLNDIFDAIVSRKDQGRWTWSTPGRGHTEQNVGVDFAPTASGPPTFLGVPQYWFKAQADSAVLCFPAAPVLPGTRITDVGFVVAGTGVAGVSYASLYRTSAAGSAPVGYVQVNAPGAIAKYTAALTGTPVAPIVLGADETLFWYVALAKANWAIYQVGFASDRL